MAPDRRGAKFIVLLNPAAGGADRIFNLNGWLGPGAHYTPFNLFIEEFFCTPNTLAFTVQLEDLAHSGRASPLYSTWHLLVYNTTTGEKNQLHK